MEFFDNHKKLFRAAFLLFLGLTIFVAILPAINNEKNNAPLPGAQILSADALAGKAIFISNGCVACHTQQVRNVDMDKVWGARPGMAADYALNERTDFWRNTATLMGTERTGPDLTNIGSRQPSAEWNFVHLFNPRIVVKESIMPAYPWLFEKKNKPAKSDVIVNVPKEYLNGFEGKIIATKEAKQLVAYLQSLKQTKLPDGSDIPEFLYKKEVKSTAAGAKTGGSDGATLYKINCQTCHQANGEGLKGAFPPLKGSPIVTGDNLETYVDIIMNGYNAHEEFGVMAAVGTNAEFTPADVTAIINFERSNWGNDSKKVTEEEIKKIMDFLKIKTASK